MLPLICIQNNYNRWRFEVAGNFPTFGYNSQKRRQGVSPSHHVHSAFRHVFIPIMNGYDMKTCGVRQANNLSVVGVCICSSHRQAYYWDTVNNSYTCISNRECMALHTLVFLQSGTVEQ